MPADSPGQRRLDLGEFHIQAGPFDLRLGRFPGCQSRVCFLCTRVKVLLGYCPGFNQLLGPLKIISRQRQLARQRLCVAFFGQGMTNLGWTVIADIAPKPLIGLTGGIFNLSANLAGIVTPIVIGVFFGMTGSFVTPLVYIAVVALVGAFAYSVILGDIHRLDVEA